MRLSRKDFLKQLSATSLGCLLFRTSGEARAEKTGLGMLYDASKCVGCRACQMACKDWNKLPAESTDTAGIYESPRNLSADTWTLIKVAEQGDAWSFGNYQCMHCAQASCVSVCPTGAAAHHGELVLIDQAWCIGCGYCVQACPFNVPHKSHTAGTARKCTFCFDRLNSVGLPACADACPTGALTWGQRDQLLPLAKERVEFLKKNGSPEAHLYGENELGGLGRLSILTLPTEAYGVPESPTFATANVAAQWLSGLVTAGVVAAVPFWLLFRRQRAPEAEEETGGGGEQK
jgi:formate dehydrogenase iron-sulfur subunit